MKLQRERTQRSSIPGLTAASAVARAIDTPYRLLIAVLVLYVLLGIAYSLVVPLGEAPDEVSHYSYVRHLAAEQRLPEPAGTVFGEVFQPPLYYAVVAPLTAWTPWHGVPVEGSGDFDLNHPVRRIRVLIQPPAARWPWSEEALAWHLARLGSTVFGLLTIVATYEIARTVLPARQWVPPLAAGFVAFLPQFTFQSGVVTNDALATALGALLLLVLARAVLPKASRRLQTSPRSAIAPWFLAGLLGGLGVWTKTSGWVFGGTTGLAWLLTWRTPWRWRRLAALAGTWALVSLPWLLWNFVAYGDPLGWNLMHQVTDERTGGLTVPVLREVLGGLYRTFWAGFGGAAHLSFPFWFNLILGLVLLTALPGLLSLLRRRHTLPAVSRHLLLWLGAHLLLFGLAWLSWTRTVLGTGQGRLLFPALPAIAVLLAAGWTASGFFSLHERRVCVVGTLLFASLSAGALGLFLAPLYRTPPTVAVPAEAVPARHPSWHIGDGLVLRRYTVLWTVDDHVPPGTETEAYFEWEAEQPLPDVRMRLQLIDSDGKPVWIKDGTPSAGRDTTDQWEPGVRVGAWHRVRIPTDAEGGWYRVMASFHLPEGRTLDITTEDGRFIGERVMVGQVTVEEDR